MPPTRTIPPAKAVKTERTHEENQERYVLLYLTLVFSSLKRVFRAYIAASRRSDRSLEARVESARRASEIHKRRTGRSLRVTEQDVINEEMYEEEDDDLPMQYRRLTAHLQTGSVDFNRRLAAYLTNQVAMRNAMDQMISNSYAQQYPNAPHFAHSGNRPPYSPSMSSGGMAQSPVNPHRSVPYPSPYQANFKSPHNRSFSTMSNNQSNAGGPANSGTTYPSPQERRLSTPADLASPELSRPLKTEDIKPDPDHQRQTQSAQAAMTQAYPPFWQDMGPFTTALPPETQQMLGPALDPLNPMTSMLMAGAENYTSNPYYPWGHMQNPGKLDPTTPSFGGMYSTLAPSALENCHDLSASAAKLAGDASDSSGAPSARLDLGSTQDGTISKSFQGYGTGLTRESSVTGVGSGQITPGEAFWDSFVQDDGWTGESGSS